MKKVVIIAIVGLVLFGALFLWLYMTLSVYTGPTMTPEEMTYLMSTSKISDIFANTQSNFAIWPDRYYLDAGKELKMSAGIKNGVEDGKYHRFVINVMPAQSWVSWDEASTVIQINKVGYKTIVISPSSNT